MLLMGPFAMLSMPSFDFHLPPCTEGFLIHLSPLWQLPLWQLPLFPSVAQFPCVTAKVSEKTEFEKSYILEKQYASIQTAMLIKLNFKLRGTLEYLYFISFYVIRLDKILKI